MARCAAMACLLALLAGCQTAGDTVIGRANGRDIVVTEAEIQKRIADRGVSRAVAMRELRREQETKSAIELQRKWKSSDNFYVENAKSRSGADQPEAPDQEAIAEMIADEQERRAEVREAIYADDEMVDEIGEGIDEDSPPDEEDSEILSKMALPEQRAKFEDVPDTEGWQTLPDQPATPQSGDKVRQGEKKAKTQVR
jgi:hypothetical protein